MLTILCELGPPPYVITGPDGAELSDRWEDAIVTKDIIRALWQGSLMRMRTTYSARHETTLRAVCDVRSHVCVGQLRRSRVALTTSGLPLDNRFGEARK